MKKFYRKHCFSFLIIFLLAASVKGQTDSLRPPGGDKVIPALNFSNTDIKEIVRAIALEYKTNIMIENSISLQVSAAIYKTPLSDVLKILAEDNGLELTWDAVRFIIRQKRIPLVPPTPDPEPVLEYDKVSERLSLTLENTEIAKLIAILQQKTGKNFLLTSGTSGKLSGTLKDMYFDKALFNILQNNGFYFTQKDSIYYITRSTYFSSAPSSGTHKGYWVSYKDGKVTIDVRDADLNKVIEDIFAQSGLPLIRLAEPKGRVTIRCANTVMDKALTFLFKNNDCSYTKDGDTYIIGKADSKLTENVRVVKLNYLRAEKIKDQIPPAIAGSCGLSVSIEHNAVVVTGSNENVSRVENYLSELDTPVPQVMIEALVIDYNLDNTLQTGLRMGAGDSLSSSRKDQWYPGFDVTASGNKINQILKDIGSFKFFGKDVNVGKLGKLPSNFYANIRFLERAKIANVKSRPLLSTLNGHPASLKIGTTQNYVFKEIIPVNNQYNATYIEKERIEKVEASVSFVITPWVGINDELTLEIKPEFQDFDEPLSSEERVIPAIRSKSLSSTVRMKNGETIVLGGMIAETETKIENKIPLLGDIPIIGELFKSKDKSKGKGELIIYLTPHIYYEKDGSYNYFDFAEK